MAVFHVPFASVAMAPVADTLGYFGENQIASAPHLLYYVFVEGQSIPDAAWNAALQVGQDFISAASPYWSILLSVAEATISGNWFDALTGQLESLLISAIVDALGISTWEFLVAAGGLLWVGW